MPGAHITTRVNCGSCGAAIVLESEGLPAYLGFPTWHEYHCPQCAKRNTARTRGAIVSARAVVNGPSLERWENEGGRVSPKA
jgi:hypothetical protein